MRLQIGSLVFLLAAACNLTQPAVAGPKHPVEAPAVMPQPLPPSPDAAQVPPGYQVEIVMTGLTYPSSIEFDDAGNMYIAEAGYVYGDESAPARVLRVTPQGEITVAADRLNGPVTDVLWYQGKLYISHRGKISALDHGALRDLVTGLPSNGDHFNSQLAAGPDGKIYFGQGTVTNSGVVGVDNFAFGWLPKHPALHDIPAKDLRLKPETFSAINPLMLGSEKEPKLVSTAAFQPFGQGSPKDGIVHGEVKANGTILRMNPDGSGLEVYAWGLRNPYGLGWSPDGKLYAADNGFDDRGSRPVGHAPDAIWLIRQDAWYGWPDYAAGIPVTDERFKPEHGPAPGFLLEEHPPLERPIMTRPPHVGVAQLDFCRSADFGHQGEFFLAEVGDMTPITGRDKEHAGYQVVRINPMTGEYAPFFYARSDRLGPTGFEYVVTAGPKRPVDVRFKGDALYVVDVGAIVVLPTAYPTPKPYEGSGVIWRITRHGTAGVMPPPGLRLQPAAK